MESAALSSVFIGSDSLLIECAEIWRGKGHRIEAVVTDAPRITAWAKAAGLEVLPAGEDYAAALAGRAFDYLFAITFLKIIPKHVLALPRHGAINFHDGPLPRYAGLNAPAWALIHRERDYGITWHLMTADIDAGDVLKQLSLQINPDETSLSLNTRCFGLAIESFGALTDELAAGTSQRTPQTKEGHTYFGRYARPSAASVIDWDAPAASIAALVRAFDFGPRYPNTLGGACLIAGGKPLLVAAAEALPEQSGEAPATVVALDAESFTVACGEGQLQVRRLRDLAGMDVTIEEALARLGVSLGSRLDLLAPEVREQLTQLDQILARGEAFWVKRLRELDPDEFPYAAAPTGKEGAAVVYREHRLSVPEAFASAFPGDESLAVAFALYAARLNGKDQIAVACADRQLVEELLPFSNLVATTVPVSISAEPGDSFRDVVTRFEGELKALRTRKPYLRNVGARFPELTGTAVMQDPGLLPIGVALGVTQPAGSVLSLVLGVDGAQLRYAAGRLSEELAARVAREVGDFLTNLAAADAKPAQQVALLSKAAAEQQLAAWNDTARPLPEGATIHGMIEAQVDRTPDAVAVACEDAALTYRQLDERANRLAAHLRGLGVGPDVLVGVHVERSIELVVATLGVLKAGGAYVPLDPAYPSDRIALMIEDSGLKVVVTQASLVAGLGGRGVQSVMLDGDADALEKLPAERPAPLARPENLSYVIYTSGSTGKPKGVMIEHRHAVNFFAGMDERVPFDNKSQRDVWLAVTSLSFDISVLELFWTLSHGFKVVVHTDRARAAAGKSRHAAGGAQQALDFSLFYFSADANAEGSERYRLLLEGARFADDHGFAAVWTPERHFHSFGGLYPNPAVTGAAVAAITKRVGIRAGSVVLPLHHPVRVAEAWSVVDNISNGRVGVSMASGWQPNDFILMPGNYKGAKNIMMQNIEVVRKLWRGETLPFPGPLGEDVPVRIMPEPVQKELPIWITTAGNAETFEMAGAAGANVLTHLLGQTVEKLAPKIAAYRKARARAGFDPNTGIVSLMLHTFVGPERDDARAIVRGPLKAYLATSMDLIKDKAWVFPAFQRPKGVDPNSPIGGNELAELSPEDRDGLLEAAFERYFETSGLFGTVDDAYQMAQTLKQIGVDDIACLVDFGVPTQVVLDHLPFLDQVRAREQSAAAAGTQDAQRPSFEEHPLLTDVRTHAVTHLQCTPSMARMFLGNEETRSALAQIQHLFLGGEALPADLLNELRQHSRATITNMYGPTETTVWSTTHRLGEGEVNVPIGRPIANTSLYVADAKRRPLPAGVAGELFIGGLGVARGYFQRPELSDERFLADPFSLLPGARMYRTGDRARWRQDGVMEFLGRADFQVKLRGYRIEPGEIEALVRQLPGVNECVVLLREDRPGDQRLVAYVVPAPRTKIDTQVIRDTLRERLPEYMVPSNVLVIDELPLTPNRKIDRKALPAPDAAAARGAPVESAKPESEIDRQIAEVWQEMLGRDGVGVDDNFFDLGGHSLLVVRVHRKLQEVLGRSLALTDLYRFPTIRALSSYLTAGSAGDSRKGSERGARRRELMQQRRGR